MPILTHVGVLQGGVITQAAREGFVDRTNLLLLNGPSEFLFGAVAPPVSVAGDSFLAERFNIQPIERHQDTFPVWHRVFIDTMFEATANALNVDGQTPLFPVFDITAAFPSIQLKGGLTLPQFITGISIPDPTLQTQIEFLFDVEPPDIPDLIAQLPQIAAKFLPTPPQIPRPPAIPSPQAFAIPDVGIPQLRPAFPPQFSIDLSAPLPLQFTGPRNVLQFLACAVQRAIPKIFGALIIRALAGELIKSMKEGIVGLVAFVAVVVIDAIASCLGIELKNALTFLAGFLVYIERLTAIIAVVLVGIILGEGQLVVLIARLLGLI